MRSPDPWRWRRRNTLNSLPQVTLLLPLIDADTAAQQYPAGALRIDGRALARRACSGGVSVTSTLLSDRSRHVALQRQERHAGSPRSSAPNGRSLSALDQLGRDSDLVARANDGPFDEFRRPAIPARWLAPACAMPLVCMTDVREITAVRRYSPDRPDDLLRHAVGEVFLVLVAGQVFERQDRDGSNLARRAVVQSGREQVPVTSPTPH